MKATSTKFALSALLILGSTVGITGISSPVLAQSVQSANDLRDLSPADWAYDAVQNLITEYGCISGFPDGTFRGNRGLTRFEFASALNGCLESLNQQIREDLVEVTANDLVVIQQLQEEFKVELETLRGRVDNLEERTAELEKNRSRVKLSGELITDVGGVFSGEADGPGTEAEDTVTAAARLRLSLDSSILGNDRLHARVEATNIEGYAGRFEGSSFDGLDVTYDDEGDSSVNLDELYYQTKVGPGQLTVGTHGLDIEDIAGTPTAPSRDFAFIEQFQSNPAIAEAADGAGIGYKLGLGEKLELAAAYTLPTESAADTDEGLFDGTNAVRTQLTYKPGEKTALAVAYARTNELGVVAGTDAAADPFGNGDVNGNHIGLSASQKLGRFDLSAHGGVSFLGDEVSDDTATAVNWAAQVGVNDLFGEGHYAGVGVGAVPFVTGGDVDSEDMPLAAQAFYSFKVKEGLAIQPQLVYINNPNGDSGNEDIFAGSIKTTLRF